MDSEIFNNSKIQIIENMLGGDTLIVIWLKLLALAGREFPDGVFIMNGKGITGEMFAAILGEFEPTVRMALKTFTTFGMMELRDGVYSITNWKKWQSPKAPF